MSKATKSEQVCVSLKLLYYNLGVLLSAPVSHCVVLLPTGRLFFWKLPQNHWPPVFFQLRHQGSSRCLSGGSRWHFSFPRSWTCWGEAGVGGEQSNTVPSDHCLADTTGLCLIQCLLSGGDSLPPFQPPRLLWSSLRLLGRCLMREAHCGPR